MEEHLKRVLVIEDDPAIARLLEVHLQHHGWQVVLAPDGLTGLKLWGIYEPQLVLLDVMLPDLSGWDVCATIRSESSLPIIMLTAKAADQDIVHGLTLGADDYLCKPFSRQQLSARIEAVLRRATLAVPQSTAVAAPAVAAPAASAAATSAGCLLLRDARRAAGLTLYQVERQTGIRWDYLQALECGTFSAVPRSEIKDVMLKYCSFLHVDARPVFDHARSTLLPIYQAQQKHRMLQICLATTLLLLIILPLFLLR